jgi:transcription elongation factor Elf1
VNPKGVARRLRHLAEHPSTAILMETVVCSKCGQRFAIRHDQGCQDIELAKKQAAWVTDQLVWDHIQERKHHATIELPKLQ